MVTGDSVRVRNVYLRDGTTSFNVELFSDIAGGTQFGVAKLANLIAVKVLSDAGWVSCGSSLFLNEA